MANIAHIFKKIWSNRPITRDIFNFKTFRAEILTVFSLLIWKIYDFINKFILTLSDL